MPSHRMCSNCGSGDFVYNGLDRVDNEKGYTIDNVVPCCKHCNYAKRNRSVEEFIDWIAQVYEYSVQGG